MVDFTYAEGQSQDVGLKAFFITRNMGITTPTHHRRGGGTGGEHIISFYEETLVLRASHSEQDSWCHTRQRCFVT